MTETTKPDSVDGIIAAHPKLPNRKWAKFVLWARRLKLAGRIEVVIAFLAVTSAIATYIAMSQKGAPFEVATGRTMRVLLGVNLALLLALAVSISRWVIRIWWSRKGMAAGSRLHNKLTGFFIGIAVVPPIIMTVFSALFLEFGLQSWFSDKIRNTLTNSLEVAQTYMLEHRADIQRDMLQIARAYNNISPLQKQDLIGLQKVADDALNTRLLSELIVFDGEANVLARATAGLGLSDDFLDTAVIEHARDGEAIVVTDEENNRVIGLIRLSSFFRPTYLYVSRDLSPNVLTYLEATQSAVNDYETLENQRSDFQLQFNLVFIIIALLILLAAIWIGLWFSSRLVTPLSNLVDASERVGKGDLAARVPSVPTSDEVGMLSRAFNRMTDQLAKNQKDLIAANAELDERRRFLEEVLEGVSAGVIGLQNDHTVFLPNQSAAALLGTTVDEMIGHRLEVIIPEFSEILSQAKEADDNEAKGEIQLELNGEVRTLLSRVSVERADDGSISGFVTTFDDVTEQLADQRTAAWADVARRIAHEIKNPLTPIQLSAERLKRKYLKEIVSDTAVFSQCTDTIIRQVGDLRRMVDEFSSFARMPAPLLKPTNIRDVIKHAVFLQDVANVDISFDHNLDQDTVDLICDGRLIGQALTNVLKNASESVEARMEKQQAAGEEIVAGEVSLELEQDAERTVVTVRDNGLGLPVEQKDRLMEPYVTTRAKGTGLGLAIVRRIMEEHGGNVRIADRDEGGASVVLYFSHKALEKRVEQMEKAASAV